MSSWVLCSVWDVCHQRLYIHNEQRWVAAAESVDCGPCGQVAITTAPTTRVAPPGLTPPTPAGSSSARWLPVCEGVCVCVCVCGVECVCGVCEWWGVCVCGVECVCVYVCVCVWWRPYWLCDCCRRACWPGQWSSVTWTVSSQCTCPASAAPLAPVTITPVRTRHPTQLAPQSVHDTLHS